MPIPQTSQLPVQRHPSIIYWFWKPDIHQQRDYLRQCQFLLNMTPFSHLAPTQRTPTGFSRKALYATLCRPMKSAVEN